jgi:hypothetical protein
MKYRLSLQSTNTQANCWTKPFHSKLRKLRWTTNSHWVWTAVCWQCHRTFRWFITFIILILGEANLPLCTTKDCQFSFQKSVGKCSTGLQSTLKQKSTKQGKPTQRKEITFEKDSNCWTKCRRKSKTEFKRKSKRRRKKLKGCKGNNKKWNWKVSYSNWECNTSEGKLRRTELRKKSKKNCNNSK